MQDALNADASDTTTQAEWFQRIEDIGEELGYFEPLGAKHSAFFVDDTTTLLVTFETVANIRESGEGQMPLGHTIAKAQGWSHLCIIADGDTWYRDVAVYRFFDRLTDDAFFEDFDRVVFYGAEMGGYAAAAYSVTAPGAVVLAVQPVATLDPAIVPWDTRFPGTRRLDFGDRYGYAPDMTEGAGDVFVAYDPALVPDAMQAALFTLPHVVKLRCPNIGPKLEAALQGMGILPDLIAAAGKGELSVERFAKLYRARRDYTPYQRALLRRLDRVNRPFLGAIACRALLARHPSPRYQRRLEALTELLGAKGVHLPERTSQSA